MQLLTQQPSLAEVMTQKANELYTQGASGNLGLSGQQLTSQIDQSMVNQQQAVKNTGVINEAFAPYEGNVGFGLGGAALKNYQAQNANKLAYQDINSQALQALAQLSDEQIEAELKARKEAAAAAPTVDKLLETRKSYLDQGLDTTQIDQQLQTLGYTVTQSQGSKSLDELLKTKALLVEQGLDTGVVDKQLASLGVNTETKKTLSQTGQKALTLAKELKGMDTNSITRAPNILKLLSGETAPVKNTYDQIRALLELDSSGLLKGQGSMSDAERKILSQAATRLKTNLNNKDFKKELDNLITQLGGVEESQKATTGLDKEDEDLINKYKGQ